MTLTQLRYILAVDRCRNFGEAARECFVTQPTLSMQIHKLEDYLQIQIFDRSKNPVEPTGLGKKVIERARKLVLEADALEELGMSLRKEMKGEFSLAVIPTLAPYLIPLFAEKFVKAYPQVKLKVFEYQTHEIISMLKEDKIDGAILATPLEEKGLKEEFLFYEPFDLFFSPNHALLKKKQIEDKDLDSSEAWLLKEGHCLRAQALQLCHVNHQSTKKNLYFEAGSLETLIQMVKNGEGFTFLPQLCSLQLGKEEQKNLRPFKSFIPVREISFVTGPFAIKLSIQEGIVEMIKKQLPDGLKKAPKKAEVIGIS